MTHLTVDQLLQAREPGLEPGTAALREHLAACAVCRGELDRLDQRVARLKALPSLRPARDHWPALRAGLSAERRRRRVRWVAVGGLAAAASVALVVAVGGSAGTVTAEEQAIEQAMARSHQLEQLIQAYDPESRVTDGMTLRAAGELERRIAQVDRQLEVAQMLEPARREGALLQLWQQRVGLLDALVDVHVTRATAVGF